jgi:ribosomal protein S18 acetylase RimI-like enzyme
MWLSYSQPDAVTIEWLAVRRERRRRGIARGLVEEALVEAAGRSVRVVTYGGGHPVKVEAEAAREFYRRLGFEPSAEIPPKGPYGPDGTPREVLWTLWAPSTEP